MYVRLMHRPRLPARAPDAAVIDVAIGSHIQGPAWVSAVAVARAAHCRSPCDDGRSVERSADNGRAGGHGLVGMRERVAMLGGEIHAGYRKDGGFGVTAKLPLGREEH
jgi:nitrate/nitrite-specific signal transduction histidine kinase